jgi:hypothetical protein
MPSALSWAAALACDSVLACAIGRGRQNAIVHEIQRGGLPSGTMRDG